MKIILTLAEVREKFNLPANIEITIEGTEPAPEKPSAGFEKFTPPLKKNAIIMQMLVEGIPVREIADKLEIAPSYIYMVRSKSNNPLKGSATDFELEEDPEGRSDKELVKELKELFCAKGKNQNSIQVCRSLNISLKTFNRLIVENHISKMSDPND